MAPAASPSRSAWSLVATPDPRIEPRWLVFVGLTLAAAGSYAMTRYNLDIDTFWIIVPGIVKVSAWA